MISPGHSHAPKSFGLAFAIGITLNLSDAPSFGGSFDTRLEYDVDGSYNSDPPGERRHNINEPKFEEQLMYNRPIAAG